MAKTIPQPWRTVLSLLLVGFLVVYSALWWSDVDWRVLMVGLGGIFSIQLAIALTLKARGRIAPAEQQPRSEISEMSWSERARYAWDVLRAPGPPGHYFRSGLGLFAGFLWVSKIDGNLSVGSVIGSAALVTVVVALIAASQRS